MKRYILFFIMLSPTLWAQNSENPEKLLTQWGENLDKTLPHNQYPRPQLVRTEWQNLNGVWQYAIVPGTPKSNDIEFSGEILVPFPVESYLSGVERRVGKDSTLWYKRQLVLNKNPGKSERVVIHFEAVDWRMNLYVNGKWIGEHEGGYDPFSFDITDALNLKKNAKQEIIVSVWDPTDDGHQPIGKQMNKPHGIWYTPVTGIWQTVWLEYLPQKYISRLKMKSDIDKSLLFLEAFYQGNVSGQEIKIEVFEKNKKVAELTSAAAGEKSIELKNMRLWSPGDPFLYDIKVTLYENGKLLDQVSSYFAFRKISVEKDQNNIKRIALNNQFIFQYGPLDQGWWPDGLYTAPSDDALRFDIEKTKEMGFNMIRKHIKAEPARWYYYCDLLGVLVWQDMPSGDLGGNAWDTEPGRLTGKIREKTRTAESEGIYRKEWKAIMDALDHFQSIVTWVPFNEAWGQFKTKEITEWTQQYDPTRLVNSASGGNFYKTGDIFDIHNYPDPQLPDPAFFGHDQALVLGEYGGLGLPLEGYTWSNKNNWGYRNLKTKEELTQRYSALINDLTPLISEGLSGAVYTQTTDVEIEVNGLMTYDRKINKIDTEELNKLHQKLYQQLDKIEMRK